VTGTSLIVFSAWKEVALASVLIARLGALAISYKAGRRWRFRLALTDVAAVALVLLVAFGFALRHDSLALNASRLLLFPIGVYLALRLSPVEAGTYLRLAVAIAVGISAFAVVQSSFFGFSFVQSYWGQPGMPIPYTFVAQYLQGPRASGTAASPNELGFALAAWGLMAASLLVLRAVQSRWAVAALAAIIVALALTFSRSAIVASVAGMAVIFVVGWRVSPSPRRTFAYLGLAILPALLLSGVIYSARGGTMLIASTIVSLSSTSSVTDTGGPLPTPSLAPSAMPGPSPTPGGIAIDQSTQAHLESLSDGWSMVKANPLGLGLGTVGSRADPLTSERPQYIIESWYLTMGVSLGWLGLAWAVFLPLAMFLVALTALRRGRSLAGLSLMALAVALAIVSYVLPTMMEPQMAMLPWSLAALAVSPASGQAPTPALGAPYSAR
jgi:hypothetical protein